MPKNRNMRILIVDDMINMRRTIRNMLRYIGYENMEEANDGDHALVKMKSFPPEFLILDWNMPRMPGIELVCKIRETKQYADVPILMVTAEVQESQIVQAAESDINGYIIKPFIAKTLEEKLDAILERKESPTEFDLFIKGGVNYQKGGDYEKAVAAFEKALEISPKSARIRHFIGETYQLKGDVKKAEQFFTDAAKINPKYVKVYQSLGELYEKTGDQEKALAAFQTAAKISPNNVGRQTTLGKLYLAKGNAEEAKKALSIAIKVEPNNPSLKTTIGEIYLESGHADKAAESFKGSLDIKKDINVYNRLGIALRRKGKVREAIDEYKKALKIEPDNKVLRYNIGRAYVETNNKHKAIFHFKKALDIDPNFKDAQAILEEIEK